MVWGGANLRFENYHPFYYILVYRTIVIDLGEPLNDPTKRFIEHDMDI